MSTGVLEPVRSLQLTCATYDQGRLNVIKSHEYYTVPMMML